jgi:chitodextrinase
MKFKLLTIALLVSVCFLNAQEKSNFWKSSTLKSNVVLLESKAGIPQQNVFELDVEGIKSVLSTAPNRFAQTKNGKIISFPNESGQMERYSVYENAIMDPALAANYPEIKSYIGIGIDNPTSTIYFSVSPLGFQSMQLNAGKSAIFIEPLTEDFTTYSVYKKADKAKHFSPFECGVIDTVADQIDPSTLRPNADDSTLRTFRLAVSTTGEYTAYFGGTKAQALAAINATMTRVNGVFEKDFAVRMVLIANTDLVIYTSASTDPYTTSYNSQVQSTLTSVIGEANYDIGHLFVRASNNGNAGCIGCVCVNGSKGSAFTAATIPTGDLFDIDYVAHEMGHQFGANHTFSFSNEGTGANMEPGSGSTIMGYAGITSQDVQPNSDVYFHAFSVQQVTNNVKNKTCQTNTATGNAVPTANAGLDYTIPRSTPFMLTGSGTDANGDALTYIWEQFDNAASNATGASSAASATRTSGPTFRSYSPSTTPVRYFPRMQSILAGATTTAGTEITVEALPSVARTMNFRFTVRDNRAGGSANNSDDMVVTVNGTSGPFTVTAPNTAVSYAGGSTQTVTWNVAGTTANGVNCANVDILISTNGGSTWTTLLASTPNDGSQAVTIPNTPGNQNRMMVKGTNHIFFDISNANFTITAGSSDTVAPTAPSLVASGTNSTSTNLSWSGATDNVAVTGYDVYRGGVLIGSTTTATTFAATGLTPSTSYTFNVRAKDAAGNVSVNSNTVNVTTLAGGITYCTSQGNSVADEYIGRVQIGTINNVSGGVSGYVDYTSISTNLTKGSSATITITPTWTGTTYSEGYAVFIDFNQDGDFIDAGETVWSLAPTTETPVSGTFTVPTTAATGPTRMRVSMKYNGIPTACETFPYGQVEDYTVNLIVGTSDTTPPTAPILTASGTTQTSTNLSWSGATDNVGVTGYDVLRNGTIIGSTTTATTFTVTGLTASTTYTFNVRAKDAAGNFSVNSNTISVTTLANTITYCTSRGNSTADEYINRVQLGTINNLSGDNGGYGNFTNLSTNLVRGTSNTITITPAWTGTRYREAYRVWIDWNRDGDFLDSGEQVVNVSRTNSTPIARSFTVPNTALLGQTRMRVSMKYNASPTSCEIFSFGEVEDYTVNIVSSGREGEVEVELVSKASLTLYPNPVSDGLLFISSETNFTSYRIINLMGQVVATGELEANSVSVSSLAAGTYLLEVSNNEKVDTKRFIKQ